MENKKQVILSMDEYNDLVKQNDILKRIQQLTENKTEVLLVLESPSHVYFGNRYMQILNITEGSNEVIKKLKEFNDYVSTAYADMMEARHERDRLSRKLDVFMPVAKTWWFKLFTGYRDFD